MGASINQIAKLPLLVSSGTGAATLTSGATKTTPIVSGFTPQSNITAIYGHLRHNTSTGASGKLLSAMTALVEVESGWGYQTLSNGVAKCGAILDVTDCLTTTANGLDSGVDFSILPAPQAGGLFSEAAFLRIANLKFSITRDSSGGTANLDLILYVQQAVDGQVITLTTSGSWA